MPALQPRVSILPQIFTRLIEGWLDKSRADFQMNDEEGKVDVEGWSQFEGVDRQLGAVFVCCVGIAAGRR